MPNTKLRILSLGISGLMISSIAMANSLSGTIISGGNVGNISGNISSGNQLNAIALTGRQDFLEENKQLQIAENLQPQDQIFKGIIEENINLINNEKIKKGGIFGNYALLKNQLTPQDKEQLIIGLSKKTEQYNLNNQLSQVELKDKTQAFNQLIGSINNTNSNVFKVIIQTTLSKEQVISLFNLFDESIEITNMENHLGSFGNFYIISFPKSSKIGKNFFKTISDGYLPKEILTLKIEQPYLVKADGTASQNFLTGEKTSSLWGITKMGADKYQKGLRAKSKIKVGVIDTGIEYTHQDIATNMFKNPNEIAGNAKDDDNNGYIDDVYGYDFVNNDGDPKDDHYHGTHVAGTIGAAINGKGVFGVNGNASLVGLKVLSAQGYGSSYSIAQAIKYAADNGIGIVNLSLGGSGTPTNDSMCNAISYAKSKGTISVVAAGNSNASTANYVPAGCKDAVTVSAIDVNLTKASFSNYGAEVDVAAPGVSVYSTYVNNGYATLNGTSMATPHIAGLLAAIKAYNPALNTDTALSILKDTNNTDPVNSSVAIGRFANMAKIMTNLGIKNDDQIEAPTNNAPTLSVASTKLATNKYKLIANATDSDGTITKYEFLNSSGTLLNTNNSSFIEILISKNTTITVNVYDDKGAKTSQYVNLIYEGVNQIPTLEISTSKLDTNKYRLTANAKDPDGTIVKYEFYKGTSLINTNNSSTVDITITTDTTIIVNVYDNLGAKVSKSVVLTYTNLPPTLTVSTSLISTNKYRITATAKDPDGTISKYEFYNGTTLLNTTNVNYVDVTITKDTIITVNVYDNKGAKTSKQVNFTYNNQAPIVNIKVDYLATNKYKITANASDSDGTIAKYEFLNQSGVTLNQNNLNYIELIVTKDTNITINVYDDKGSKTTKYVSFKYTNLYPTLQVSVVKTGDNNYTLTASASDSDGTIVKYEFLSGSKLLNTSNSNIFNITITQNMNIQVIATDDKGAKVNKWVYLKYLAPNIDPKIQLIPREIRKNYYTVYASGYDKDGRIIQYNFFVNGSGFKTSYPTQRQINLTITQDTKVQVVVTDDRGGKANHTIDLIFKPNTPPTLNLSYTTGTNYSTIQIKSSDEDGQVISHDITINGSKQYYSYAKPSTIHLMRGIEYIIKVLATDNQGGTIEKEVTINK